MRALPNPLFGLSIACLSIASGAVYGAAAAGFPPTLPSLKLIDRPPGSGVIKSEVEEFALWELQLQALYVAAAERILSD